MGNWLSLNYWKDMYLRWNWIILPSFLNFTHWNAFVDNGMFGLIKDVECTLRWNKPFVCWQEEKTEVTYLDQAIIGTLKDSWSSESEGKSSSDLILKCTLPLRVEIWAVHCGYCSYKVCRTGFTWKRQWKSQLHPFTFL